MQTFLPYADFDQCARVLDDKRLGKQRVEAKQILNALERRKNGTGGGWVNHPAVRMWEGCEDSLKQYANAMIVEWVRRGFNNNMDLYLVPEEVDYPRWLGDDRIHAGYRSNLLRKSPDHYGKFGWAEPNNLPYHWPA
jgi:hypothetical protein